MLTIHYLNCKINFGENNALLPVATVADSCDKQCLEALFRI